MKNYNNGMPLALWMRKNLLPKNKMAEKYTVGQDLTKDQAEEITKIIAFSVNFQLEQPSAKTKLCCVGSPYRDFVVCITQLMLEGSFNAKWEETLWNVLDDDIQSAIHTLLFSHIMAIHKSLR